MQEFGLQHIVLVNAMYVTVMLPSVLGPVLSAHHTIDVVWRR